MSVKTSIAVTGMSSLTGHQIAIALARAGYKTWGLCSRPETSYSKTRTSRLLKGIQAGVDVVYDLPSEFGAMETWIKRAKPKIWVHHHHPMKKFREMSYDLHTVQAVALNPLESIVEALVHSGCQGVIYSGTYFEPGEGAIDPSYLPTPYAQSKAQVWKQLSGLCRARSLPISKILIPNVVGPGEAKDRLIPRMLEKARAYEPIVLGNPLASIDHLPVADLAKVYVEIAQSMISDGPRIARPSGAILSLQGWSEWVNAELLVKRLCWSPCLLQRSDTPPSDQAGFKNPKEEARTIDWSRFWDEYADYARLRYHSEV